MMVAEERRKTFSRLIAFTIEMSKESDYVCKPCRRFPVSYGSRSRFAFKISPDFTETEKRLKRFVEALGEMV